MLSVRKGGFWHNGSPTNIWGSRFWPSQFFWVREGLFPHHKGKMRNFFNLTPKKVFSWKFSIFGFFPKLPKYSSFEIFGVNFGVLAPAPYFLGFHPKKLQFWISYQKDSKYFSFEIFGVKFCFLAPGPLFFRFLPKNVQILHFSPKRPKILQFWDIRV